jgi:predicted Fe-S protein YdhL (DUF1289 family)
LSGAPPRSLTDPPSPCIRLCRLDEATQLCVGCWRTIDEIIRWGTASAEEKRRILDAVAARRPISP